jgi:CBS domain-containing protein
VGWGLVAVGLAVALLGDTLNGVMLGLTGWFLSNSARAAVRRVEVEDLLRGVTVGEVMERDVPTIAPQLTLDTFADQVVAGEGPSTIAVTHNDELLGVIGANQVRRVGRGSWTTTRAEQLMIRLGDLPALDPHETVWTALDRLRRADVDGLPVVDASRLLGVVTRAIVVRTIQSQARLRGVTIR